MQYLRWQIKRRVALDWGKFCSARYCDGGFCMDLLRRRNLFRRFEVYFRLKMWCCLDQICCHIGSTANEPQHCSRTFVHPHTDRAASAARQALQGQINLCERMIPSNNKFEAGVRTESCQLPSVARTSRGWSTSRSVEARATKSLAMNSFTYAGARTQFTEAGSEIN